MRQSTPLLLLAVLISYTHSAPQLISFQDGKLGVNFGGYHAGVGIGGLLGGSGGAGGLYAEAGTPTGQAARAGLGGVVSESGGASGGLYAGATAGGNIKASAGLAGGVTAEQSAGAGYASAQAGNRYAASGLGGESSIGGASEFSFSGTKDVIAPIQPIEVKPIDNKIHAQVNVDAYNEIQPLQVSELESKVKTKVIQKNVQPVLVKEVSSTWNLHSNLNEQKNLVVYDIQGVLSALFNMAFNTGFTVRMRQKPEVKYAHSQVYVQPETKVVEKQIIRTHYKPRRHHFRKTAFVSGYVGGQGGVEPPVVYQSVEPQIQKRIDVTAESAANAGVGAAFGGNINGGVESSHTYRKQVTVQKSPTFFEDIFNIPISTLKAVSSFLGNTAANTNISVQKSASVQAGAGAGAGADTDTASFKHVNPSSSSSSAAHVSIETPSASKFIDDIFSIPINTLGAVNQFLQNNVGKKTVQVAEDGSVDQSTIRRRSHARRKGRKQVVIQEEIPVETVTAK